MFAAVLWRPDSFQDIGAIRTKKGIRCHSIPPFPNLMFQQVTA
jgi:hypothetical protein